MIRGIIVDLACIYLLPCLSLSLQTPALQHYSTYSESEVLPCVRKIASILIGMLTSKQQAVRNKYSSKKYLQVSKMEALHGKTVRSLAAEC